MVFMRPWIVFDAGMAPVSVYLFRQKSLAATERSTPP